MATAADGSGSLLKRWLLGMHQGGVAEQHLDAYLDEFVFRFNRRTSRKRGCSSTDCSNWPSERGRRRTRRSSGRGAAWHRRCVAGHVLGWVSVTVTR